MWGTSDHIVMLKLNYSGSVQTALVWCAGQGELGLQRASLQTLTWATADNRSSRKLTRNSSQPGHCSHDLKLLAEIMELSDSALAIVQGLCGFVVLAGNQPSAGCCCWFSWVLNDNKAA